MAKLIGRERRKLRIRSKISGTEERPRLSVFRSGKHIYAQVVLDGNGQTVAAAVLSSSPSELFRSRDSVEAAARVRPSPS